MIPPKRNRVLDLGGGTWICKHTHAKSHFKEIILQNIYDERSNILGTQICYEANCDCSRVCEVKPLTFVLFLHSECGPFKLRLDVMIYCTRG